MAIFTMILTVLLVIGLACVAAVGFRSSGPIPADIPRTSNLRHNAAASGI